MQGLHRKVERSPIGREERPRDRGAMLVARADLHHTLALDERVLLARLAGRRRFGQRVPFRDPDRPRIHPRQTPVLRPDILLFSRCLAHCPGCTIGPRSNRSPKISMLLAKKRLTQSPTKRSTRDRRHYVNYASSLVDSTVNHYGVGKSERLFEPRWRESLGLDFASVSGEWIRA